MEYGEEVGALRIFEPQRLSESIKFEPENRFCCSIFPIQLLELFLGDRVIRVVVVSQENVMYPRHRACANMTQLVPRGRDDKTDKVVYVYLEQIPERLAGWVSLGNSL